MTHEPEGLKQQLSDAWWHATNTDAWKHDGTIIVSEDDWENMLDASVSIVAQHCDAHAELIMQGMTTTIVAIAEAMGELVAVMTDTNEQERHDAQR